MKQIEVVAAIIVLDGRVFSAQRGAGGETAYLWEFPGGKIEPGESHTTALIREIEEEFSSRITVERHVLTTTHQYSSFQLTMHAYLATPYHGDLIPNEHAATGWFTQEELTKLDWAPADLPIVEALLSLGVL